MNKYNRKSFPKNLIKCIISILLLYLLFRSINIKNIIDVISKFNLAIFVYGLILWFIGLYFNAIKWKFLINDSKTLKIFNYLLISQFYSFVLPGQISGEASKILLLRDKNNKLTLSSFSVILDKIIGILALIILGILGMLFSRKLEGEKIKILFLFVLFVFIFVAMIILVKSYFSKHKIKINLNRNKYVSYLIVSYNELSFYLMSFKTNKKSLIYNFILSIFYIIIGTYINIVFARELNISITLFDWLWIQAVITIALLLPITIGGIGIRECGFVGLMSILGINAEKALAFSLLIFALQLCMAIVGGILEFHRNFIMKNENR